jgi:glucose-1-phosphate adenylyltransferase
MKFPDHIYSGLTVVGKNASIPEDVRIGTNCIIYPAVSKEDFPSVDIEDGETVEKRE